MFNKRKILIIGAGYVGSASAIHLSQLGHKVFLLDKNKGLLKNWAKGILPFQDSDLEKSLSILKKKKNSPTPLSSFLPDIDLALIAVATPVTKNKYDLSQLKEALESLLVSMQKSRKQIPILIRSTLPPNTMREVVYPFIDVRWKSTLPKPNICYFPEFMREGSALKDLRDPALCVLGVDDHKFDTSWVASCFGIPKKRLEVTGTGEAELLKVSCNVYHGLKVCFANEVAELGNNYGINSREVMRLFCMDNTLNISKAYFKPGFSFGGPCLEKEVSGIFSKSSSKNPYPIINSILTSNNSRFENIVKLVKKNKVKNIGILGLAFKAGSVDTRNSPICKLIDKIAKNYTLYSYKEDHDKLIRKSDFTDFLATADLILLGSASLSADLVKAIMNSNVKILDLCLNFENYIIFKEHPCYQSIVS